MSTATTLTSRKGLVPCSDKDLYSFLTDMRNFSSIMPEDVVSDWQATEGKCSFKIDKAGKVAGELLEALPYTLVSYEAETFLTGKIAVSINIDHVSNEQSEVKLSMNAYLNPFIKMMLGDSGEKYLEKVISAIESYDGYDKIRGNTQYP